MTDTSFYNTQSPNALTQIQGVAGTMNALNTNKLFQQEFAGRQAMGDIYSRAIDPKTGMFDPSLATTLAASNPNAGFVLPQIVQQGLENNHAQLMNSQASTDLYMKHLPILQAEAQSIAEDPNPTYSKVQSSLASLVDPDPANPTAGKIGSKEAVGIMQQYKAAGDDPNAIKELAGQHLRQITTMMNGVKATMPDVAYQDTGNGYIPIDRNPMSKTYNAQMPLVKQLPPDAKVYNAKGQASYIGPQNSSVSSQAATANVPEINASSLDPAAGIQLAGNNPNPPGADQFAEAPPGAKESAAASATANAGQAMNLQQAAATVPQQKALLGQMESKLGDFTSGPGSQAWKELSAGAQRLYGGTSQSVASNEDFNKMASMIAQQQFQSLGGTGTDAKLDSAMSTSPNSALSGRGNKEIIHMLKGNADAIGVMNNEWQKAQQPVSQGGQGLTSQDYGKFQAQFNQQYDPRAFQLQYMTPSERKDLLKGMSPSEQTQFRNAVNTAGEKGWIPDPRSQNGQ